MSAHPIDAYAEAVVSGRVPAGRYHRLACARHLRDRQRRPSRDFPYRFVPELADRFVRFAQRLKHYKGEWAGQYIQLQPYQVFRLGALFAWVDVYTGLRRFRTAYNELPRKNGKSLEAAIVALYVTFFDGEPGGEGYCIAMKRDQARIVFNDCRRLVLSSGLRSRIAVFKANLHREATASKLEPLGADRDSTDGLNPNLIITDEYHAQKDRGLVDVMETATGSRRQPINFQITTAGSDPDTPCGQQHHYACQILDQVIADDTFFAFIAHADVEDRDRKIPADDWRDEATWRKANPNYGVSVRRDDLAALARKAQHMPAAAAAFQQKRLNIWVHTLLPWLSVDGWRRGQSDWRAETLHGQPCWIGIDMSSKIDLTAVVAMFPPTDDRPRWRLLSWCLTPDDTLDERALRDRAPYRRWVERGWLATNPGNRIDEHRVLEQVLEWAAVFDVQQIGLDPWHAGQLGTDLIDEGFDDEQVVEIPQTFAQMSAPSKDFEADVLDGIVDAGGNELVQWAASNVVVKTDNKDNIYPTKKHSRGRIDPIVAALMARKLAGGPGQEAEEEPVLITA